TLGYSLCKVGNDRQKPRNSYHNTKKETASQKKTSQARTKAKSASLQNSAKVVARVYITPGETKTVEVTVPNTGKENVLWSSDKLVPNAICAAKKTTVEIPITNSSTEARMYRCGETVGQWDTAKLIEEPPLHYANMLERTTTSPPERTATLLRLLRENKNDHENETLWQSLVEANTDVFAVTDQELTQTTLIEHDIDTGTAQPIRQKARPIPLGTRMALRQILLDLQDRNIIQPSKSSWASPIVLVQKKDGSLRLCVDYRRVNQVTRIDSYPLPTIDAMLQNLKGKKFFTTLDLSSGYWQIKLSPRAQEKSAFTTTEGLYEFKVLPFGLASSPPVFQRMMHAVLGHLLGDEVACYLDDVMVATSTVERHLDLLNQVFGAFRNANLKLNPRKCVLLEQKVEFLGHMVDAEGVHMDPRKVSSILDYPLPQTRAELRTFIGMCSYYRKFVLGFSKVAGP
ncbi:reverse transcriptase, partial [Ancylostoma caninum]